jgi:hypothetical protein
MKFFTHNEHVRVAYIGCIVLGRFCSCADGYLMSDTYIWIIVQSTIWVSCAMYVFICVKNLYGRVRDRSNKIRVNFIDKESISIEPGTGMTMRSNHVRLNHKC